MSVKIIAGPCSISATNAGELKDIISFNNNTRRPIYGVRVVGLKSRTELKNDATRYGIAVTESAKLVGGFLHKHQGRFLQEDQVQVTIINNGTGPKIYKIEKSTIDTIDENNESTIDGFEKASIYGGCEPMEGAGNYIFL